MKTAVRGNIAPSRTTFACRNCGYNSYKWMGRCSECGEWNSLVEVSMPKAVAQGKLLEFGDVVPELLENIEAGDNDRVHTGLVEFDRILGGGVVPGSLVLLGGPPGIGKSTLMLQVAGRLQAVSNAPVLYVSGEESLNQIKNRAGRLGVSGSRLYFLGETRLEKIIEAVTSLVPGVMVLDSIQTTYKDMVPGTPGSVAQIKECTAELMHLAKVKGLTIFVLGHVTKEGDLAGPRILEHMVDTVLYFESEHDQAYRILRVFKNRFGATREIGVFQMSGGGLSEVSNPSRLFLSEGRIASVGAACVCSLEGTRPLLLEIQALVSRAPYGVPRRSVNGLDNNRVLMILAVLEKRCKLQLYTQDVFANVAGGAKTREAATDLGLAVAVASAYGNWPVDARTIFMGEVALDGNLRPVSSLADRIAEAKRMGFNCAIVPKSALPSGVKSSPDFGIVTVTTINELMEKMQKDG